MTKDFAESLTQIVADVSDKHADDIDAAVDECERRVKRPADFADFTGELIRQALREQIYDCRHKANTEQRKASRLLWRGREGDGCGFGDRPERGQREVAV